MSFNSSEKRHNVEGPDQEEMIENTEDAVAMELFQKILKEFSHHDFTWQDIEDSFNDRTKRKGHERNYDENQLEYLVERGLLDYDEAEKSYSINNISPEVAKIIEEE